MTSDSDDLEQALQENLKLRRELAANVTAPKAASKREGMAYRLGWVLYWTCLALIGLYATFWLVVLQDASGTAIIDDLKDWSTILGLGLPVVGLYGLGRAFRYVLSGE
jgi:hypothetical protein